MKLSTLAGNVPQSLELSIEIRNGLLCIVFSETHGVGKELFGTFFGGLSLCYSWR